MATIEERIDGMVLRVTRGYLAIAAEAGAPIIGMMSAAATLSLLAMQIEDKSERANMLEACIEQIREEVAIDEAATETRQ